MFQNDQILQSSIKSLRKLSRSNQTSSRQVENGLNLHRLNISLQVKFSRFLWFLSFLAIYLFFICLSALKYKTRRLDKMTQHPKLFFSTLRGANYPKRFLFERRISRFIFFYLWFSINLRHLRWDDKKFSFFGMSLSVWCLWNSEWENSEWVIFMTNV